MYRNARQTVAATLSNLSEFCDVICAIDDRSTDGSVFEVRRWPKLGALIMLDADISTKPWHFSEDILYEALYRMAEPFHPDWVIQLDADETLEPANSVRPCCSVFHVKFAALLCDGQVFGLTRDIRTWCRCSGQGRQ